MIARRELLIALGVGALSTAMPLLAQQQPRLWHIGILAARSRPSSPNDPYAAFTKGMSELGYIEGKDYAYEWVYADGDYTRLPGLAAELVRRKVDIIVPTNSVAALAAQRATNTIPIVVAVTPDPVAEGFAASLARPGGNMTGQSATFIELSPKFLELLRVAVPKLSLVAVVVNPGSNSHPALRDAIQSAAEKLHMHLRSWSMGSPEDFERGFAAMSREGVQGVVVLTDAFFLLHRQQLTSLALKFRLPSIYYQEEYVASGGLLSYGFNLADMYRSSASFVDKIMKGAKPGDVPFAQPTRFFLVINRKTAKALGLKIPQELLLRADRVIE